MSSPVENSFVCIPTAPEELIVLSKSVKLARSTGPDEINPLVAAATVGSFAKILSDIINCSFPLVWYHVD